MVILPEFYHRGGMYMYYIGIDLGGTKIAAGLVNKEGRIIRKSSVPTYRDRDYKQIIKDMALLVQDILKVENLTLNNIERIGIGLPGSVNKKEGKLFYANNFKAQNIPVAYEMRKHINVPVYIENDANCAALAESVAGAAKDTSNSLTITLGTGIGGGIIIGGKIYSGFNSAAGELGHMVIEKNGENCTCGRKGCWESYASAVGLIRQTRKAAEKKPESLINTLVNNDLSKIDAKTAFDAERQGDKTGTAVVNQYIKYLSEGIVNLINIFTPEVLVVGGGISKEGENLLERLRENVKKHVYFKGEPSTKIVTAQLGNDAGIVGAAMTGQGV